MKALLMHPDRDFDVYEIPSSGVRELIQDLDLNTLLRAMAGNDEFLLEVARTAVLCAPNNKAETILYRQQALKDCLQNPVVIGQIYGLVVTAIETTKRKMWGITSRHPSSLLYSATDLVEMLVAMLRELRESAAHATSFRSEAFTTLFAMLQSELQEGYLLEIQDHLSISKFKKGIFLSARLGDCNESADFVLRRLADKSRNWFHRLLRKGPPGYTFRLPERDEAGARILSEMRHRGISRVAVALAESADHVLKFFKTLRTELAFYIGCANLYRKLAAKGESVCFPIPCPMGCRRYQFHELYDVNLSLRVESKVVGNTGDMSGKSLVLITGANQGGKSSFLRSLSVAQLMMQCGMFVGADYFEGEVCPAMFTHYRREEGPAMQSGKFAEELARMNDIVERIIPNAMLFLNESFAATNEREGSEIARQIVSALLEKGVRIFYVTHLYEFTRAFFHRAPHDVIFLRAERKPDGTRTFKITEGEPLETSYGEDLYREIFGEAGDARITQSADDDQHAGTQDASSKRSERECHTS